MWHFYQLQRDGNWFEPIVNTWSDAEVVEDLIDRLIGGYHIDVWDETFIEMTKIYTGFSQSFKWRKEVD